MTLVRVKGAFVVGVSSVAADTNHKKPFAQLKL
jgi:hypothetical protein